MKEHTTRAQPADTFSADWLALREPIDHASRCPVLVSDLCTWADNNQKINVIDLGTGTGSNLRFLAPLLGHAQRWTLVDNDEQLLNALVLRLMDWAESLQATVTKDEQHLHINANSFSLTATTRCMDVSKNLASLHIEANSLVTASALLDLTSQQWLRQLVEQCVDHTCVVYFALNYNGEIAWEPSLEHDELVQRLQNEHQRTDKGLGLALGPQAADYLGQCLIDAGRAPQYGNSSWRLGADQQALVTELMQGWINAAIEQDQDSRELLLAWQSSRLTQVSQGKFSVSVGHTDVLSLYTARF